MRHSARPLAAALLLAIRTNCDWMSGVNLLVWEFWIAMCLIELMESLSNEKPSILFRSVICSFRFIVRHRHTSNRLAIHSTQFVPILTHVGAARECTVHHTTRQHTNTEMWIEKPFRIQARTCRVVSCRGVAMAMVATAHYANVGNMSSTTALMSLHFWFCVHTRYTLAALFRLMHAAIWESLHAIWIIESRAETCDIRHNNVKHGTECAAFDFTSAK